MLKVSLEVLAATCGWRMAGDKLEETSEALRNAQDARAGLEQKVKELAADRVQMKRKYLVEGNKAQNLAPRWIGDDKPRLTDFGNKYDDLPDNME
ncbi:unnamed protein product [Ectocarpus sp. CCAP 1310/34]|nr:unnamed protein product [Ectocarpus sp. CCAP 1310/34]